MKGMSLVVAAVILLSGAAAVSAQKKSTGTTSSVTLNIPARVAGSDTVWPALGDYVTFTATYPKHLESKNVRIQVLCYQDAELVYGEAGPHYQDFLLGGAMSKWYQVDGHASCVADLYYWSYNGGQKFNWLASTEFDAAPRQH